MERMGHSSTRATLIYLHATRERDETIARGMGQLLTDARKTSKRPNRSGTQRARGRNPRLLKITQDPAKKDP